MNLTSAVFILDSLNEIQVQNVHLIKVHYFKNVYTETYSKNVYM